MKPLTSIIIVNFNGKKYLSNCLDAVYNQSVPKSEYEVIIVDNNSSDGSVEFLKSQYPQVKLIESKQNLGFAAGNNLGVSTAEGKYIALLNNDTKVDKNWLKYLVEAIENDQKTAAVNSKTYLMNSEDTKRVQNAGNVVFKSGYSRDRGAVVENKKQTYEVESEYFNQPTELTAFCGVSVIIRKDLYQQVGGFDESLFMYYEDIDMSLTLKRLGYKILYQPKSMLKHVHSASSNEWSSFFTYHVEKNHLLFTAKHFPLDVVIKQMVLYKATIAVTLIRSIKNFSQSKLLLIRLKAWFWFLFKLPDIISFRKHLKKQEKLSIQDIYQTLY